MDKHFKTSITGRVFTILCKLSTIQLRAQLLDYRINKLVKFSLSKLVFYQWSFLLELQIFRNNEEKIRVEQQILCWLYPAVAVDLSWLKALLSLLFQGFKQNTNTSISVNCGLPNLFLLCEICQANMNERECRMSVY